MKINKIFSLSMQSLKQNLNKNLIIIIPIVVITILLLIVNMIQFSIESYIDSIKNNIELRTISGIVYNEEKYQDIIQKLEKIEHISMIADLYELRVFANQFCDNMKTDSTDGYINIQPANSQICPEVISGRKINDNDQYVIVLPDKLYASSTILEYDEKIRQEEYIQSEELLGETVTIRFDVDGIIQIEKEFEVIGIYDSVKYNDVSTPYVPKSVIKDINIELGYEQTDPNMYSIKVVVDDIDNVEYVEEQLNEQNLINTSDIEEEAGSDETSKYDNNIASVTHINISTQNMLKKIEFFLLISSVILFVALLIVTNTHKAFLEKREFGIMKLEGYNKKDIQKIKIIENFLISLISIVGAILIFKVLLLITNVASNYIIQKETINLSMQTFQEQLWYVMQIPKKINWILFTLMLVPIIIIELINTYMLNKRNLSKSIIELLKE